MPKKIRELKSMLLKAGFVMFQGKGDHTKWTHAIDPSLLVVVSGNDGRDAKKYQEKQVAQAIAHIARSQS
jgi:predicted RNA binding protein YcfA (HicA-like mRNA interferase family)